MPADVVSNLPVLLKLEFLDGTPVLDIQDYATWQSSYLYETTRGISVSHHIFQTNDWTVLEETYTKAAKKGTPRIRWRFGERTQALRWEPWQHHLVAQPTFIPTAPDLGPALRLNTYDHLMVMKRIQQTKSWKGLISEMVSQIASAHKIASIVEPTQSKYSLVQSFMADTDFLSQRLLPRAVNKAGRGDYRCYIQGKDSGPVLHFHTDGYQGARVTEFDLYGTSGIIRLEEVDHTQEKLLEGAGGIVGTVHDLEAWTSRSELSHPEKLISHSKAVPDLSEITQPFLWHLGVNKEVEAQDMIQSKFARVNQQLFQIKVTIQNVISIHAGDTVNMIISTQQRSSFWSGAYTVAAVEVAVKNQAAATNIWLERGTFFTNNADKFGKSAPGLPLNVGVIAANSKLNATDQQRVSDALTGGDVIIKRVQPS